MPLLSVHVFVDVKPGHEEEFKAASFENARHSVQEAGIVRFDVLQVGEVGESGEEWVVRCVG